MVAQVAALLPETAAKMVQPITLVCSGLAGFVQRIKRRLVDQHRDLGQPGLGVHPVFI